MNNSYLSKNEAFSIDNLMPGNQNVLLGSKLKYALDVLGTTGTAYYLDPTNGNDNNDGLSVETAVKTLPVAYALTTSGKNDAVYYIAGTSSISLSSALDWSKSYTHLIGICAPSFVAKRARIFQASASTGINLLTVSGSSNIFRNLYVFHGVADATSKICLTVTGERNYFDNCHFAGIGDVTMSVAGSASVKMTGSENYFSNCAIGLDTVARDADATEIWLDGGASRNKFENCMIYGYTSATGYSQVTIEDGTAIDRWLWFKDCIFSTDSTNQTIAQTSVFNIKTAIVQGKILLQNCMAMTDGTAVWDSNSRGIIYNNAVAPAASGGGGIMTNL